MAHRSLSTPTARVPATPHLAAPPKRKRPEPRAIPLPYQFFVCCLDTSLEGHRVVGIFHTADDAWEAGYDALVHFANSYSIDIDSEEEEEQELSAAERCSRLLEAVRDEENWPDQDDPVEIDIHVNVADVPR